MYVCIFIFYFFQKATLLLNPVYTPFKALVRDSERWVTSHASSHRTVDTVA